MTSYKIALSGPAGSGKTTLAGALGKALSLPVLPEGVEDIYRKRAAFEYAQKTGAPATQQWEAVWAWMDSHFEWCQVQAQRTADLPGFVADRWEMDIMSNWICAFAAYNANEKTQRLHQLCQDRCCNCGLAIALPVASFDIEARKDLRMKRHRDMVLQLSAPSVTKGLARLIYPPEECCSSLQIPRWRSVST